MNSARVEEGIERSQATDRWLLGWMTLAFVGFVAVWTAGIYREYFGFDPRSAPANFTFNMTYLFPGTLMAFISALLTGGITLWRRKRGSRSKLQSVTLALAVMLVAYVLYYFGLLFLGIMVSMV